MNPMNRYCWIAISTLLAACSAAAAEQPPFQPHRAEYSVERNGREIGRLEVSLKQREDGLWNYRIESNLTAWYVRMLGSSTTESAWLAWRDGRVRPLTYHHVSREPGRDRFWQHEYDWERGVTQTRTHKGEFEIELTDGAVDPLTLRLRALARLAETAPAFSDFSLKVVERDKLETQEYRFVERQRLQIGERCYDTAVFRRFRKPGSGRNYSAWHAEGLGWLPVKIEHDDDGTSMVLELVSIESAHYQRPPPGPCDRHPG